MCDTSSCSFLGEISIPGAVTLTVNSDLNGASPQFTFTCISTDGPATTVSWTRDSENIGKGMTVFNDPVTARYTHTLTMTGRLPGVYKCSVENDKHSNAETFTVKGKHLSILA